MFTSWNSRNANNLHSTVHVSVIIVCIVYYQLSPSRKARHSGVVGISSWVMSGISDDPLSLDHHYYSIVCYKLDYLSLCCIVWEGLHLFHCFLHWLLSQTTHNANVPMATVHWKYYWSLVTNLHIGMTITLSDVAISYAANAWKLGKVDVLRGQHTSASETMNQPMHNNTSAWQCNQYISIYLRLKPTSD